jgi:hypothetical protein
VIGCLVSVNGLSKPGDCMVVMECKLNAGYNLRGSYAIKLDFIINTALNLTFEYHFIYSL